MNRFTLTSVVLAALVACGPGSSSSDTMPKLPGDGDDNTAKPKTPGDSAAPDPWAGRDDLIESPKAQPPREVKLPDTERFTLKNGLDVIVVANHDLPVVSMELAIKSGWSQETREKRGVADFSSAMLTKGTKKRSAEKIAETIDFVGGSVGASSTFEATFASCSALSKDLKTCLQLLPDIVANPTFPEKEMKEVRNQTITAIRQRRDDAAALAGVHFQNELWGDGNVRGWPETVKSIESIERADLVAWHQKWFKPNHAVLAVAGDVDPKKVRSQLEAAFGVWRKGKVPALQTYEEPTISGIRVRLVDKPDQTQSQILAGHLGIAHTDPDYYSVLVMNYALGGGGFSSRLMKVVRSEGGKTYGARSGFDRNLSRGAFSASTFTRNSETLATLKLVLGEVDKMKARGPTDSEVDDAKANITGQWPTRFETGGDVASSLLGADLHGFNEDYVRKFALRVGAVSTSDAKRAAAKRLDPANMVIVIVGKAADVEPQLKQAGWKYEVISVDDPITKIERDLAAGIGLAPVSAADVKKAEGLINAALKAKGGKAKLAAVTSMTIEGDAVLVIQGQTIPGTVKRVFKQPDALRLDLALSMMGRTFDVITVVHDGKGWSQQPGQGGPNIDDMEAAALVDAKQQIWRDSEFILLRALDPGTKLRPLGEQKVDGTAYDVVQVTREDGKVSVQLFLDAKTRMLGQMTYLEGGEEAVEAFGDYKKVSGIAVAHTRTSKSPQGNFDTVLKTVKFNAKVPDSAFAKPE